MKRKKAMFLLTGITSLLVTACGTTSQMVEDMKMDSVEETQTQALQIEDSVGEDITTSDIDLSAYEVEYTDRDTNVDWQTEDYTTITAADTIVIQGDGASNEDGVITISKEGTYVFSGVFDDNAIRINAPEAKIRLVFQGVEMTSTTSAPLLVEDSKKVVITLADGTQNTIYDYRSVMNDDDTEENVPDAAIFSYEDITFQGEGTLQIISQENNGITVKGELLFMSGNYLVDAAGHGITGKDFLIIHDGEYTIKSGKDGLRSTKSETEGKGFVKIEQGTITIEAGQDGIQAESFVYVEDGNLQITTNGGNENGETHREEVMGFGGEPRDKSFENRPDFVNKSGDNRQNGDARQEFDQNRPQPPQGEKPDQMKIPEMDGQRAGKQDKESQEETTTKSCKGIKGTTIYLKAGTFVLDTADDAIHANENGYLINPDLTILTGDDGIHADASLEIYGGSIDVQKSYEGLEGKNIAIWEGNISIVASDDGINVAGGDGSGHAGPWDQDSFTEMEKSTLTIAGGSIYVNAAGDGLDSNGSILQTGGNVIVDGPENGMNGALDYDSEFVMNGGTLLAIGSSQMLQTASDDSMCYAVTAYYTETLAQNTEIEIWVGDQKILTHTTARGANAVQYMGDTIKENDQVTIKTADAQKTVKVTEKNVQIS